MAVLVAGGTGALGGAVVRELLDSGYACTLSWVIEREREQAESELGDRVTLVEADLSEPEGATRAIAAVDDLEAVVNLVGGFAAGGRVHETDPAEFARLVRLNLTPGTTSPTRRCRA